MHPLAIRLTTVVGSAIDHSYSSCALQQVPRRKLSPAAAALASRRSFGAGKDYCVPRRWKTSRFSPGSQRLSPVRQAGPARRPESIGPPIATASCLPPRRRCARVSASWSARATTACGAKSPRAEPECGPKRQKTVDAPFLLRISRTQEPAGSRAYVGGHVYLTKQEAKRKKQAARKSAPPCPFRIPDSPLAVPCSRLRTDALHADN